MFRYKTNYQRDYVDELEEAVRKNVLMQHVRYFASGNRQGASFEMGTNFMSDRLDVELEIIRGAARPANADRGEAFPHSSEEIEALKKSLPRRFDWTRRGAVTHVRSKFPAPAMLFLTPLFQFFTLIMFYVQLRNVRCAGHSLRRLR